MSNDAGMLSAALGAAHYCQQPSIPPRYYQCVTRGLKTTCEKTDTASVRLTESDTMIEVPASLPAAMDRTYVAWRIRSLSTIHFKD